MIDEGGQSSAQGSLEDGQEAIDGIDPSFAKASSIQGEVLIEEDGWSSEDWVTTDSGSDEGSDDDDSSSGWGNTDELLHEFAPDLEKLKGCPIPLEDVAHPLWDPKSEHWQWMAKLATAAERKKNPNATATAEECL